MQSAGCQQTSSRDVPNFAVTSNDESYAAYCHSRRCCPDMSSDSLSTSHSSLMSPLVVTQQTACQLSQKPKFHYLFHNGARLVFILGQTN